MQKQYDIAAYVWPAYTGDEPRTRIFWPEGMGEWQTVKNAGAKFEGHNWPRKPVWGYVNEADPYVMEMEIEAAVAHGVNVFIYDWYWYDQRPFLEQCLQNGFLKARNRDKMRFYLMWANHDLNYLLDIRQEDEAPVIWRGAVDRREFDRIVRRLVEKFFSQPNYYTIGGRPVFMIYDVGNLVSGLGGVGQTRQALDSFRRETERAGFPGLHLQLTAWGEQSFNFSGVDGGERVSTRGLAEALGFDSITNYQFAHLTNIDRDYGEVLEDVKKEWRRIDASYTIPYFPHVSVGWDNNPRFRRFRAGILKNNTPERFKEALEAAKDYLDRHSGQAPLVTLNSWNEWTESSYLQPDDLYGYGYLDAVRAVFGPDQGRPFR